MVLTGTQPVDMQLGNYFIARKCSDTVYIKQVKPRELFDLIPMAHRPLFPEPGVDRCAEAIAIREEGQSVLNRLGMGTG